MYITFCLHFTKKIIYGYKIHVTNLNICSKIIYFESIKVTGPSFISPTSIIAPNCPVFTGIL